MKSVDSLNISSRKKKNSRGNSRQPAIKKRVNSFNQEEPASKNKPLIFWVLIVFSAGIIFISWLFFLKVELKDVANGGTFSKVFSSLGQAMANTLGDLAEIKNINFEKLLPEAEDKNQNKEEVSPQIKELEERVFPQFEE